MTGPHLTNNFPTFNDGVRSIDYVLVWDTGNNAATKAESHQQRRSFESILKLKGLQLEYEVPKQPDRLYFIKVHAPVQVLREYCENLKLRMPMKFSVLPEGYHNDEKEGCWDRVLNEIGVRMESDAFLKQQHRLTAIYSKNRDYLFDQESEDFWKPSTRFRIVQYILENSKSDSDCSITRLLSLGIYSAAYPLHDGDVDKSGSMRYLLNTEWASLTKILKYQPLDCLKDYFGVKIALYFSWLGFYTLMLIPASVIGFICFIYSAIALFFDKTSDEICNYNDTIKMCPSCDDCDYWDLKSTCNDARLTALFDNPSTVLFAAFMSLWAACVLEFWKRYSAEITHRWDLTGFDVYHEHPRQQYLTQLAHVKKTQLNPVTGQREPKVPFWRMKVPATVMSYGVVFLLVLAVIAAVLGVVVYRISMSGANALKTTKIEMIASNSKMFTTVTAALINLLFIIIFGKIYESLAVWLTEKELLRTQTEFDNSLTLKIYLLQFVNYYASIFYIAFFKGKFVGKPGNYVTLFGFRQEECPPGGCLLQLSVQLAIIMIGKQLINAVKEMATPYLSMWWKTLRTFGKKESVSNSPQWVKDYKLVDFETTGLFPEYLEMVLQFGFITIFVTAFPLAPLFALLNNILEIRLDAKKFIQCYRRTVPQRIKDIGVWYRILDTIGKLSVLTNALIIAFTSEFIPRLVYKIEYGTLAGYIQYSFNDFSTSGLQHSQHSSYNESICRYPNYSYYKPEGNLQKSEWYWHVMGARLAFVLIFQNTVTLIMIILRWAIPDMPRDLHNRIKREEYMTNKIMLEQTTNTLQANEDNLTTYVPDDIQYDSPEPIGFRPL